jgi:hypothetical protein
MLTKCQPPILYSLEYLYNKNVTIELHDLLFDKFLKWQEESGGRKTLKQFAEYIGMGQVYLNQIMNRRRSAGEKTGCSGFHAPKPGCPGRAAPSVPYQR